MVGCVGPSGVAGDGGRMNKSGVGLATNDPTDIQDYLDAKLSAPPFLPKYTVVNLLLIPPSRYPFRLFAVTNGAGNRWAAMSDGSTWRYLDGTAV